MKMKKVFLLAAVAAVAGSAWLASGILRRGDDLFQENLEVLTDGEEVLGQTCYNTITSKDGSQVMYCPVCDWIPGTDSWFSPTSTCQKR